MTLSIGNFRNNNISQTQNQKNSKQVSFGMNKKHAVEIAGELFEHVANLIGEKDPERVVDYIDTSRRQVASTIASEEGGKITLLFRQVRDALAAQRPEYMKTKNASRYNNEDASVLIERAAIDTRSSMKTKDDVGRHFEGLITDTKKYPNPDRYGF